jgi:hypothetical protein
MPNLTTKQKEVIEEKFKHLFRMGEFLNETTKANNPYNIATWWFKVIDEVLAEKAEEIGKMDFILESDGNDDDFEIYQLVKKNKVLEIIKPNK